MKQVRYGLGCMILGLLMFVCFRPSEVFAASASIQISSATITQGSLATVTVTISADTGIEGYQCAVLYDSDKLEWISDSDMGGGGGRITVAEYNVEGKSKHSFTLQFRGIAPGNAAISIENSTFLEAYDADFNDISVSGGSGTVTVNAPVEASDNCRLASLALYGVREDGNTVEISFSPAFSSATTDYTASVGSDISGYAIQALAEDGGASIATDGETLKEGSNTTTITVTAANGNKKVYRIVTEKEKAAPVDNSMLEVTIDGKKYVVARDFDTAMLTEGFEKGTLSYAGQTVSCGISVNRELKLLYLTEKDKETGSFFLYQEDTNSFYPFRQFAVTQKLYTILPEPDLTAPEGFAKEEVSINGTKLELWKKGDYCLFYGLSYNGNEGWYLYEITEGSVQRFDMEIFRTTGIQTPEKTATATDSNAVSDEDWYQRYREMKEKRDSERLISIIMVIIFGALSILFLVIMLSVVLKYRSERKADGIRNESGFDADRFVSEILKDEEMRAVQGQEDAAEETVSEAAEGLSEGTADIGSEENGINDGTEGK